MLETFVPFRDHNAIIKRYILETYVLTSKRESLLNEPKEVETWCIGMAGAAFDRLDDFVNEVPTTRIPCFVLMRDVGMLIISKSAYEDGRKWMTEISLQKALREFENTFGAAILTGRLEEEDKVERKETETKT